MLYVANSFNPIFPPVPTPLLATHLPGATATIRVPADNVSPSVSSPYIDANARGNNTAIALSAPLSSPALSPSVSSTSGFGTFLIGSGADFWASPQAPFLAQIIGQDNSLQTQAILIQYEKLVALAQVKYRPSNATLPVAEPSGLFGRFLHEEHAGASAEPVPQALISRVQQETQALETVVARVSTPPTAIRQDRAKTAAVKSDVSATLSAQGVRAYRLAITRYAAQSPPPITHDIPIEETHRTELV